MNIDPSWDHYRSFLAVMRDGSLSGAARTLGLTQPTLSRHIDALEAALGRRLFLRSQRGLVPTAAAQAALPYAEAFAATDAALRRATAGETAVAGSVRITASEVFGTERLPPILAEIRRRHPGLALELALSNAVENLIRRDADIAVRMVAPAQEALVARRIGTVEIGFFARSGYLARRGTPEHPDDLRSHDVIGFDSETPALRAMLARYPWIDRDTIALRSDSDLAQLAAIRAGFGIGACQTGIAARDPDLVRVLPVHFAPELRVWLAMHGDLRDSPRCRAVFDMLAAGLARALRPVREKPPVTSGH